MVFSLEIDSGLTVIGLPTTQRHDDGAEDHDVARHDRDHDPAGRTPTMQSVT